MNKIDNDKKLRELCKASLEIEALYKIFHHLLLTDNDDTHLQLTYLSEIILKKVTEFKNTCFHL